ncbi:MAG TPA: hypothetical protein VF160_08100 [Candidatus Dormibacteraeota bacterium]
MPDRALVAVVAVILVLSGLVLVYSRFGFGSPVDLFHHRLTQAELWARPEAKLLSYPSGVFISRDGVDEVPNGWGPPQQAHVVEVQATSDPEMQVVGWYDGELQSRGWSRVDFPRMTVWEQGKLSIAVYFDDPPLSRGPQPPTGYREFSAQLAA